MPRSPCPRASTLMAGLALAVGCASPPARPPGEDDMARALGREVELLQVERELAREKGFYLKLEVRQRRLALLLAGVTLQEHALVGVETGERRVAFVRRSGPADWPFHAHLRGRLSPARERERREIEAPAPSPAGDAAALEPSPPAVPPTAEEAYSVPALFRIVFEDGVSVEVVAGGDGRNRTSRQRFVDAVRRRAADLANALSRSPEESVRLRIVLDPEDAASLYRSLPPDVDLVVTGLAAP